MDKVKGAFAKWADDWWKPVTIIILAATLLFFNSRSNAITQARLEDIAFETHTALCTFAGDLERRLEDTREYLSKHPEKEPIPGITRGTLRRSVQAQQATVDALSNLEC